MGSKELTKSDNKFVITIVVFPSHCTLRLTFSDAVQSNEKFIRNLYKLVPLSAFIVFKQYSVGNYCVTLFAIHISKMLPYF